MLTHRKFNHKYRLVDTVTHKYMLTEIPKEKIEIEIVGNTVQIADTQNDRQTVIQTDWNADRNKYKKWRHLEKQSEIHANWYKDRQNEVCINTNLLKLRKKCGQIGQKKYRLEQRLKCREQCQQEC